MSGGIAVKFENVSLHYRVFHERGQSLKGTIISKLKRSDRFEIFPALRNISFEVKSGESVAIVGRNGSGKTTLLKLVANIFPPSAGRVIVNGKVAPLLELGAGFHPDLTGLENIYLNASLLGLTRRQVDERLQSIIEFSELGPFIDAPLRHYSSGMFMRLGFAVAVHVDPDVLLFDEVIAVGDQGFQKKCFEKIMEIRRRGKTMLVVSHVIDTLRHTCDRALLLDEGRIVAFGPLDEVAQRYAAIFRSLEEERRSLQSVETLF